MEGIDFVIVGMLVAMAFCLPNKKDIFEMAKVSCRYVIWVPTSSDRLSLTCQLASAPLNVEEHVACNMVNCPLYNRHMKGKVKNPSDKYNEVTPLTEGDTLGPMKPHKPTQAEPIKPPPAARPKKGIDSLDDIPFITFRK